MTRIESLSESGYRPGVVGRCTALMSTHYARSLGVGAAFEADLAVAMAGFLTRAPGDGSDLWTVWAGDALHGCAALDLADRADGRALFRWFFLDDPLRGQGLGRRLLRTALAHARRLGVDRVDLHTHPSMTAARALYAEHGFRLVASGLGRHGGQTLPQLHLSLHLASHGAASAAPRSAPAAHPGTPHVPAGFGAPCVSATA